MTTSISAGIKQINEILIKIKGTIQQNDGKNFIFKHREKNNETLTKLGWLPSHVKQEILQLTYKDYCRGPEANTSRSGNQKGSVWTFGRKIKNLDIYIKLHVIPFGENRCVCISFHEAEAELNYPYQEIA